MEYYLKNMSQLEREKREFFINSWKIIHSMHTLEPYEQLKIFFQILQKFDENKTCICGNDAFIIFKSLFNNDIVNFYKVTNYKEFWIYFHNLINLKLNKKVFLTKRR